MLDEHHSSMRMVLSDSTDHLRGSTISSAMDHQQGGSHTTNRELAATLNTICPQETQFSCPIASIGSSKIPYVECINLIAAYSTNGSPVFVSECDCILRIRTIIEILGGKWKEWVLKCSRDFGSDPNSGNCTQYTNKYMYLEKYALPDGTTQYLTPNIIANAKNLWELETDRLVFPSVDRHGQFVMHPCGKRLNYAYCV